MDGQLADPPEVLKLIGNSVRWNLLAYLARSDYRVQDLVAYLKLPQNLISYHLRQLRGGNLVTEKRSSADERSMYYSIDLEQLRHLYVDAGTHLHPALSSSAEPSIEPVQRDGRPLRVLFLCTENSARSQMAEALMKRLSQGTIEAYSAGSHPAERVHPLAVRAMADIGVDMGLAAPKHFDLFRGQHFDAVITVCDRVREVCPIFPDDPERIHWSFPDPAQIEGSLKEQYRAFEQTSLQLATRIRFLITLLQREKGRQS